MECQACEIITSEVKCAGQKGLADAWDLILRDEKTVRAGVRFLITISEAARQQGNSTEHLAAHALAHKLVNTYLERHKLTKPKRRRKKQ